MFSSRAPPGTGKTLLARYLATASGARFVDARDFPLDGDEPTEADVAALFRHARAARERDGMPVVLFWDELDELCEPPFGPRGSRSRIVSALLAELDGVRGKAAGVLLVACSNRADELDPALLRPGRLGVRIELRPPDPAGQRALLAHHIARYPQSTETDLDALAPLLADDTAAAIEEAVAAAWRTAVARTLDRGTGPQLEQSDLRNALLDRLIGAPPSFLRVTRRRGFASPYTRSAMPSPRSHSGPVFGS